jgi:HPt (histidine-containing phosphotransfer) domain-containing protein
MFLKTSVSQPQLIIDSSPLTDPLSLDEIQARVRRRYIDRLSQRVKRMRRMLLERNWSELKIETRQLREAGESFGFAHLTALASTAEQVMPNNSASRLRPFPEAKQAVESLLIAIDLVLAEASVTSTN